jgi:uncharacterized protein (TIGR00297 family)
MDDVKAKAYVDACFAEYRVVRDESVASTAEFFRIVQFGGTAVLGFIGLAATFWRTEAILTRVLLGAIIPTLSFIFIESLTGQVARIRRAGKYCRSLEAKLQLLIGDPFGLKETMPSASSIGWETWIEGESIATDQHYTWIYTFGILVFFVTTYSSLVGYIFYAFINNCVALTVPQCIIPHRPSVAIMVTLIVFECCKLGMWTAQASQIARPLTGLLFLPKIPTVHMLQMRLTQLYSQFLSSSSPSGIIVVGIEALLLWAGFGVGAGVVILSVAACGTAASIVRGRFAGHRERAERRDWRNAVANAGVATGLAVASLVVIDHASVTVFAAMAMASLNATLSDTISHELGVTFGGVPRLITTFRLASPGDNGAISVVGTVAGLVSAFMLSGWAALLRVIPYHFILPVAVAGFCGNLIDSLLGATVEGKAGVGNHTVNVVCIISAALVAFVLVR